MLHLCAKFSVNKINGVAFKMGTLGTNIISQIFVISLGQGTNLWYPQPVTLFEATTYYYEGVHRVSRIGPNFENTK